MTPLSRTALVLGALSSCLSAQPVIHELMIHPGGLPEDSAAEFIELFNPTDASIDLSGWELRSGITYQFGEVEIESAGYLVICANVERFRALYPGVTNVVGPWEGKLRNRSERVRLLDVEDVEVDEVIYADEGDWALRERGPEDRGHRGWVWRTQHDGDGHSLELIQPELTNRRGQNWKSSLEEGGTPGRANSVHESDSAPLIFNVRHTPVIPRADDPVTVTATIRDELPENVRATLHYRRTTDDTFVVVPMMIGDAEGRFGASIPPHDDQTILAFFVEATDGSHVRQSALPEAPCLYQVEQGFDDSISWEPASQPHYRIIMSETEAEELRQLGSDRDEAESNARMNATFISMDGTGTRVRYLTSVRNRGATSRLGPPNNFLVQFRSDDPWQDLASIKFNVRNTPSQTIGPVLFHRTGIAAADALPARLWVNGASLIGSSYAQVESFDRAFVANHFPKDPSGNLYQVRDDEAANEEGDLRYEGADADAYRNTYFKQTNDSEDDWSDLITLTQTLQEADDASYTQEIAKVLDIDQWLRVMAVDALLGNREGGLTSGKGDDYALYRGTLDTRFKLIPHDLDTLLGMGRTPSPRRSIWSYGELRGLERFFDHPEIAQRYLATLLDLLDTFYTPEIIDPLLDQVLGDWVSDDTVTSMKNFVRERREGVLEQIEQTFTVETNLERHRQILRTNDGAVIFSGKYRAARTCSIHVNGRAAVLDPREGEWMLEIGAANAILSPGINRIHVEACSAMGGMGELIDREELQIWWDQDRGREVSGILTPDRSGIAIDNAELHLRSRSSYLPGIPFIVRVDLTDSDGNYRRDLWDGVATLTTDREEVRLMPNQIRLVNGVGSALVNVRGLSGDREETLVPRGATWRFLDDGSDQGTAWRAPDFDDSEWSSGEAELGYGDDDEATTVGYGEDEDNKHATTYFRTTFQVLSAASFTSLNVVMRYDDAAAVYLNGSEVIRTANLSANAAYDTYADDDVDDEDRYEVFEIEASMLVDGANVLAVEVHQGDGESSDISFDLELMAQMAAQDAGDFTIRAEAFGLVADKAVVSWQSEPLQTVSGVLEGDQTSWSGIVHITDDLSVPEDHVLEILPGTLVLLNGEGTPESEDGADIDVLGTMVALGDIDNPISFTARQPGAPWGEIHLQADTASAFRNVHISRAGHAPPAGHTSTGPAINIDAGELTLDGVVISHIAGKIMEADHAAITIAHSLFAHAAMGPETDDCDVAVHHSSFMEMRGMYREDGVVDDDDGIYLQGNGNIRLENCVVSHCDDDGIDTLNASVDIIDCITRNVADKGTSHNDGHARVHRLLSVNNAIGVQAKSDGVRLDLTQSTLAENGTGILLLDAPEAISIKDSIVVATNDAIDGDPETLPIDITYSNISESWPGEGNLNVDPLFVNRALNDFRLQSMSPLRDAGAPDSPVDSDGSRADIGRFEAITDILPPMLAGTVTWRANEGPIRVVDDVVVPENVTLIIEPGTSIYVAGEKSITVNGVLQMQGSPQRRIQVTADPAADLVADLHADLPMTLPHWGGIQFIDSLSDDNIVAYADIGYAQSQFGSVGIIRSQALIDHCTFHDTHLRMIYADRSSVIVQYCDFPDMFAPDERADALGLDNISEHIKGVGKYPPNGHFIIQHNVFGTNKGHNDVIDVDSGLRPEPILQILNNEFAGAGDELLDLGGDVYVAGNLFRNVFKDDETSDRGYANAISTGDATSQATVVAVRNIFWDVDHAINLKRNVDTIFEHNTVYMVHPDFDDRFGHPNVGSVVNLYVDEPFAQPGKGAFLRGNLLIDIPRVFGNIDLPEGTRSLLGFQQNFVDHALEDPRIALLGSGTIEGTPGFVDAMNGDFTLADYSEAKGSGPFGMDFGAVVPDGAWIEGEPSARTRSRQATLRVGGPGMVAFRYRVNDGPWSEALPIGDGFAGGATVRTATVRLTELPDGVYQVAVIGQNFAGVWQDEDMPTLSKEWQVDENEGDLVLINEIFAGDGSEDDYVELWNPNNAPVRLTGWRLADRGNEVVFVEDQRVEAQSLLVIDVLALDREGDTVRLYRPNGDVADEVVFGLQSPNHAIGRIGDEWTLVESSPGRANSRQFLTDPKNVVITEWAGAADLRLREDFVELHNPAGRPVSIGQWNVAGEDLPPLSFLDANGYAAIATGVDRLRETLFLTDTNGSVRDVVLTDPQVVDTSQARDGGYISLPTPGASNEIDPDTRARLEHLLAGLRVTEIMYHPENESEAEFIELRNVGEDTLDLAGVRFTEGVRFTFPAMMLEAGAEIVVAANQGAMNAAYGVGFTLAGLYEGRLANGGEEIALLLPSPYDVAIMRFRYRDDWIPETDGGGFSLTVRDAGAKIAGWSDASHWQASLERGGDPGGAMVVETFGYDVWQRGLDAGEPEEDPDGDGLSNLEEYAYGTDPHVFDRHAFLTVHLSNGTLEAETAILDRPDVVVQWEHSEDLVTWTSLAEQVAAVQLPRATRGYVRVRLNLR